MECYTYQRCTQCNHIVRTFLFICLFICFLFIFMFVLFLFHIFVRISVFVFISTPTCAPKL